MSTSDEAALAYSEPSITVILTQSSFLILLNVLNWAFDALLYCGLIGQILVGIAWGTPGGQILSTDTEHVVVELGYIGLILLVFEGGLSTSFPSLKANIALSAAVAITGIAAPIALSFILAPLVGASDLQCFAAGAALCSTSLGTTFAVLRSSGLISTRLGVVLASAAMLDDVVGLVMIQVISNLGGELGTSISAVTVIRPIIVSIAFVIVTAASCRWVVQPVAVLLNKYRTAHPGSKLDKMLCLRGTALTLHSALLVALVTAASYAGTSNLFAAYIAGAVISWWDSEVSGIDRAAEQTRTVVADADGSTQTSPSPIHCISLSGSDIYNRHYHPAVKWVLQPLFFASIGFSIPITRMFGGTIIWRGIIYAVLMATAKLLCGLWLVRISGLMAWVKGLAKRYVLRSNRAAQQAPTEVQLSQTKPQAGEDGAPQPSQMETSVPSSDTLTSPPVLVARNESAETAVPGHLATPTAAQDQSSPAHTRNSIPNPPKPLSLYPSAIIGLAMVPRGEIGFLVSSVAQSNGVFGGDHGSAESEILLIVTWAIVLCTVLGPLCVGLLVRRIKRLELEAASSAGPEGSAPSKDVLGVWGIQISEGG